MTSQDHDTDPSTPGAKRRSDPRAPVAVALEDAVPPLGDDTSSTLDEVAALAAQVPSSLDDDEGEDAGVPPTAAKEGPMQRLSRPTTNPGIAPPPESLVAPAHPMRIVVPSVVPKPPVEAVDVLLDGIRRDPSERRTKPDRDGRQSDGRPPVKYHGEHAIPARRISTDNEPKVVIARQPLAAQTVRIAPGKVMQHDADHKAWAEMTSAEAQALAGRVFVAILAGLIVVTVIFVSLRRTSDGPPTGATGASVVTSGGRTSAAAPVAPQNTAPTAVPMDSGSPRVPDASDEPQPSASSAAVARSPTPGGAQVWKPGKAKAKPTDSAARPPSPQFGEFKTTF